MASLNAATLSSKFSLFVGFAGVILTTIFFIIIVHLKSVTPKNDDNESAISATSEKLVALTEQNVHSHSRTNIKDAAKTGPSNVSTSIEIISTPKSSTLTGGQNDDFFESATTETIDSTGSKRKRVRHRKKKNANAENQMNLPNVEAAMTPATASATNVKRDVAKTKNPFEKPQSKSNTHVR